MLVPLLVFAAVGVVVSVLRGSWAYFALFGMCGALGAVGMQAQYFFGRHLLTFRRTLHAALVLFFVVYLMIIVGVSFQFSQVFFDAAAGVVSGALIQLVVGRLVLPFVFGNGCCSTVCWNGIVFDRLPSRGRRSLAPWTRYCPYVVIAATVVLVFLFRSHGIDTARDSGLRRTWVLAENGGIFLVGLLLASVFGGRFYCRVLCPFHAVSRLFARYSITKIGLKRGASCTRCGACAAACPFEIPVPEYVASGRRVLSRECILCERCVAACPSGALELTVGHPLK